MATPPGVIIAAPASGSGKTLLTLGLLAALKGLGVKVASAKIGPDYIDPAFHAAATGRPCSSLDGWAMRPATVAGLVTGLSHDAELVVCEGVMGLLDGAALADGQSAGSTADMAALTGWPVVLVIDGRGMTTSAAAVLRGFTHFRQDIHIAGVIFNRVTGDKHRRMIAAACARACPEVEILGYLPRLEHLEIPSRHLGLVQACEHPQMTAFLTTAAQAVGEAIALDRLAALARPTHLTAPAASLLPVLGNRIAVAQDDAFSFVYPSALESWRRMGAELTFFSPLDDQAADGDAIYLPGGYPELHAGRLAANDTFLAGLRRHAAAAHPIFGECGGYMVLGQKLVDGHGQPHAMAGLLRLDTNFAQRRLHLGYRQATLMAANPLGMAGARFRGHEFHYAAIESEAGDPLFTITDAAGTALGSAGLRQGSVMGSFIHLIDRA